MCTLVCVAMAGAGMGKGEYMFQSSAWRDGEVAGLSGCAAQLSNVGGSRLSI